MFGNNEYIIPSKRVVSAGPVILPNSHDYIKTPYDKVLELSSRKDTLYKVTELELDTTSNEDYFVFRVMSSDEQTLKVLVYYESDLSIFVDGKVELDLWESFIAIPAKNLKAESFYIALTDSRNGIYKIKVELD